MRKIAMAVAACALAACADDAGPVTESSGMSTSGGTVTFRYADDPGEAGVKAAAYCAKYRRRAFLHSTSSAGADKLATYECR